MSDSSALWSIIAAAADEALANPASASDDGWALPADAVAFLEQVVGRLSPPRILEFGSGVSTCALARSVATSTPSSRIVSLDHDPDVVAQTNASLEAAGLGEYASVHLAPLVLRRSRLDNRLLTTYRVPDALLDQHGANLAVVDGPPDLMGGREGSVLLALASTRAGGMVVLDDAAREREASVIDAIEKLFGEHVDVHRDLRFERGLACLLVRRSVTSHVALRPSRPAS